MISLFIHDMTCFLHFPTKIYGHAVYVSLSFSGWREFVNIPVGILENVDTLPEVAKDEKGVVGYGVKNLISRHVLCRYHQVQ